MKNNLQYFHNQVNIPNCKGKDARFLLEDIVYLEGNSNYTLFYLNSGKVVVSPRTMLYHIENSLNETFLRIHKKYCVNINQIQSLDQNDECLLMQTGKKLTIARRRKHVLCYFK